jgi:transcription antitermination factor NusG
MTEEQGMAISIEPPDFREPYPWFALQVRTRREAFAAGQLAGKGYELFLPVYKSRRLWSDRIKELDTPLFPGYLFCRFDPQQRLPILKTLGVIQIIGRNRVPVPVDEQEITAIQRLVASGLPNQPWPFLSAGDKVRIESGALRGVEGILTGVKGSHRLVLAVSLLQRSVAVDIDSACVTLVSPSRAPRAQQVAFVGGT